MLAYVGWILRYAKRERERKRESKVCRANFNARCIYDKTSLFSKTKEYKSMVRCDVMKGISILCTGCSVLCP